MGLVFGSQSRALGSPWFPLTETGGGVTQLTATSLLQRRQVFRQNLVQLVKEHHKVNAQGLWRPLSRISPCC